MSPTLIGMAIYAAAAIAAGLLVWKYVRWTPPPAIGAIVERSREARRAGWGVALAVGAVLVLVALAFLWGLVAARAAPDGQGERGRTGTPRAGVAARGPVRVPSGSGALTRRLPAARPARWAPRGRIDRGS